MIVQAFILLLGMEAFSFCQSAFEKYSYGLHNLSCGMFCGKYFSNPLWKVFCKQ